MNEKIKAAAMGGVILGLLSAIPFVNIPNLCCCLWAILGGVLATFLWVKKSPTPVSVGEGALVGVIAGAIGAVIYLVIGVPLGILLGNTMGALLASLVASIDPQQGALFREQMAQSRSIGSSIVFGFIWALLLVIFSTIGGLIGVPIFEKRKSGPGGPPPPQGFGGPQGGSYPPPPTYGQQGGGYSA